MSVISVGSTIIKIIENYKNDYTYTTLLSTLVGQKTGKTFTALIDFLGVLWLLQSDYQSLYSHRCSTSYTHSGKKHDFETEHTYWLSFTRGGRGFRLRN